MALGEDPGFDTEGEKRYKYCYLMGQRLQRDKYITSVPGKDDIARINREFPDVKVVNMVSAGKAFRRTDRLMIHSGMLSSMCRVILMKR